MGPTLTGSDLKNMHNKVLSAGMCGSILLNRSTTKTTLGWMGSGGKLNFGMRVTMRVEVFGMVRFKDGGGEERDSHLSRRTKSAERVVDVCPS
jgi:hypothetical protein